MSTSASWAQIEGQFGELLLCKPMIKRIDAIARTQQMLYTWDVSKLIIKILQKTTRRFKVETILETVTVIASISPVILPLTCGQRIRPQAFESIKGHLNALVVEAVSSKGKEQGRQLQALVSILKQDLTAICVGYEVEIGGSEPADLIFENWEKGLMMEGMVVEIESMPPRQVQSAYTYLKGRYADKMQTIGRFITQPDCPMWLMMPVGTVIPGAEWEKIKRDEDLLVWQEQTEGITTRVIKLNTKVITTIGEKIAALQVCVENVLTGDQSCTKMRLEIYRFYMRVIYDYMLKVLKEADVEFFAGRLYAAEHLRSFDVEYDEHVPVDTKEEVRQDAYKVLEAMGVFLTYVVEE